ncbi:MAG: 4-hydroxy-3-methylbut-2-enyl diphosphate reductase [Actinobacteria bacterium]|nr:4-hydroxy-3-methylbut-2-enyl diphosphate reductase [Actinomycetota bacterium]
MKVITVKGSGYCFGVKRALKIVDKILSEKKSPARVYTLGSIIHNPGVVKKLSIRGLISINDLSEMEPGSTFIVRSHGMPPGLIDKIKASGVKVIDATCPFVKNAHMKARHLGKNGYFVVVIGDENHPEVIGIKDHVSPVKSIVAKSVDDLDKINIGTKTGVVVQTTQTTEKLKEITGALVERCSELLIYNTICDTTKKRQDYTRQVAESSDVMIIVGGKNSANTTHLADIARSVNPETYHIENQKELEKSWFSGAKTVGVSGGASTPEEDILKVKKALKGL